MAEQKQVPLKPTMVATAPTDKVAVKDVYEEKGSLSKINQYVSDSPTLSKASDYLKGVVDKVDDVNGIDLSSGDFIPNADGVKDLLKNSGNIQTRIKDTLSGGYGSLSELTDNLKTSLIGEVVSSVGINPEIANAYKFYENGSFDGMSVSDYAATIVGAAGKANGLDVTNILVQIDGVQKLVECDPFDLKSMASILTDMTGNSELFSFLDVGAITGTLSTVLQFANDWSIPELVKHALDSVDDYELKLKMLKNSAISASVKGDVKLTKYYVDELEDKCDNIPDITGISKYGVDTIAHMLCTNLIRHYRINEKDKYSKPQYGNELIAFLTRLNPYWIHTDNEVFNFNDLSLASKDALDVLRYTEYRAPATVAQFAKQRSADDVIRATFPQLLVW